MWTERRYLHKRNDAIIVLGGHIVLLNVEVPPHVGTVVKDPEAKLEMLKSMRGHDHQNPVSNSDVANLNSVVPNCCFIRT